MIINLVRLLMIVLVVYALKRFFETWGKAKERADKKFRDS